MSRVFVAHDTTLDRDIVVKVLPPEMAAEVSTQRFKREIQLAARLQHPHIVPLHSAGEIGALPYFTMPFVEGETLRARLSQARELPIPECVRILRDIAGALAYAHSHGVVHRDIKPENVLLTGGSAVVTDFGVAKALTAAATAADTLTSRGVALGTPTYMSPEQASADPGIDHRTDIYSLGLVAYEMLAGRTPFAGRAPGAMIAAHIVETPEPIDRLRPSVPAALADLTMRCLAKRPADRPQKADEIVQTLDAIVSTGVGTHTGAAYETRVRPFSDRSRWLPVAGVALAAVIAVGAFLYTRDRDPVAAAPEASVRSIAVLPFVNLAGTADDEYFSEGMSDELSAALGRIRGLQVASRTSTFAFKDTPNPDIQEIGQKLRVDAVLEGRVRRSGNRLRLNVQLTNVASGLGMWADSYEREVKDVFAVQDDIARSIAAALQVRLAPAAATTNLAAGGTQNLEAYDEYLRGRYAWHRRGAQNLIAAARHFERAVQLDERFARAYAGIAITYALLPEYTDTPPPDARERTERAVSRALALDSTIAEAYAALGLSHVHAWRWGEAAAAYKKAIALDPRYATAHQWYGELLYHTGNVDEAVLETRRSAELDPLAPIAAVAHAYALFSARRYAESLAESRRAFELAPGLGLINRVVAFGSAYTGDTTGAILHMERAIQSDPEFSRPLGELVFLNGYLGRREAAVTAMRRLRASMGGKQNNSYTLAIAYIGLADRNAALSALEDAVRNRELALTAYSVALDPLMDSISDDPRFAGIMRGMNLPESALAARARLRRQTR